MDIKNWSVHIEFVIVFVTLIGGFYTVSSRTDRIYDMYCAQVEDSARKWEDSSKKWVEVSERNAQMWVHNQREIAEIQKEIKQLYMERK